MAVEKLSANKTHFEAHHENQEDLVCMGHDGECSVLVEIAGLPEEQRTLETAAENALLRLDGYFDGRFSELFSGLHIQIGDNLTDSGAEALAQENKIVFDRRKMLLSLVEAEGLLSSDAFGAPTLDAGDWTRVMPESEALKPGTCLEYNLIHEVGHLLDEQMEDGDEKHRIAAQHSPTRYGRVGDQHNDHKDHEAFAEGFAYMVYGAPVSDEMASAVGATVQKRIAKYDAQEG